jgi:hypothetical protein
MGDDQASYSLLILREGEERGREERREGRRGSEGSRERREGQRKGGRGRVDE